MLAWYTLAILGLAALLRWGARPAPKYGPVLALAMGAVPVPLLFTSVMRPYSIRPGSWSRPSPWPSTPVLPGARIARRDRQIQRTAAWAGLVFILIRLGQRCTGCHSRCMGARETQSAQRAATARREVMLFGQAARIDRSLAAMGRARSAQPRAFFLGFAGVGDEKVFAQEIGLASRVLGERYDIGTRSLSLINDERDLARAPLATVSGLRYALRGLGARMNLDRDVLFLAISSHGAEDPAIMVYNSQLPLDDMTDEDLVDALRESGIKWRVIIISACYAGGFIECLLDPQTIVITAAAADRTSFGCSNDRDLTYFGEAFYRDALPGARSLREAFDTAKAAIAARERANTSPRRSLKAISARKWRQSSPP